MNIEISPETSKAITAAVISQNIRHLLLTDPNSVDSQKALAMHNDGSPVGNIPANEVFIIQNLINILNSQSENQDLKK